MTHTRFRSCVLVLLLALSASGCELVADFDRSRIPQEASDSGSGGGPDGSLVPSDSGGPVPDGGPPVPDAGPPAVDAAVGAAVGDGAAPAPVDAG